MKKSFAALTILMIIFCFAGFISCKSNSEKKDKKERVIKEADQKRLIDKEIKENVYPLPTSAEVIKTLTEMEVGYNLGISNPPENAKKYYTSADRAINLGAYGADLSYATLYNMDQQVIDYMNAIRILANDLNMSNIYDEPLYDSIKKNFDNRVKLVDILTKAFDRTYAYMSENEQQALALLVVGGAWVEGMYLTCNVNEAAYNHRDFSKVLIDQKKSFELFIDLTKPYVGDPAMKEFLKELEPVRKVYERLSSSLTEKDIKALTEAVNLIRGRLLNP